MNHQFVFDRWALRSGTLLRWEIGAAAGGFDMQQEFGEDWELWLRLSIASRFACLAWPSVLYRHRADQESRTVWSPPSGPRESLGRGEGAARCVVALPAARTVPR